MIAFLLLTSAVQGQGKTHPEELQLQESIDKAINRGVDHLFEQQFRDGSWGMHGDFVGGRAGLCLYTMLQCGVSRTHPSVKRAIAYLRARVRKERNVTKVLANGVFRKIIEELKPTMAGSDKRKVLVEELLALLQVIAC